MQKMFVFVSLVLMMQPVILLHFPILLIQRKKLILAEEVKTNLPQGIVLSPMVNVLL